MPWSTSNRRDRLPKDWPAIRERVKQRAHGQCQAQHHEPDCDHIGTDADHIQPGDNHDMSNLQWLSHPCHVAKTVRDNTKARAAIAAKLRRPTETHPGAINTPGG